MSSQEQFQRDRTSGGGDAPVDPPEAVQGQINTQNVDSILDEIDGVHVFADRIQIDMVFFTTDWDADKAARYPAWMLEHGAKVTGCMGGEYRMVCHHDIARADCETAARLVREFAAEG